VTAYFIDKNEIVFGADIKAIQKENYFQVNPYEPDYDEIFSQQQFSLCINASGSANVKFSFAQPKIDFDSNTMTVFRILNAIRTHQPTCKFINLSSAAVYGNSSTKPLNEDLPCNPVSPYGYHKWYAELICKEYANLFNLKTCSARLFSVYGEGQEKLLFWDMWNKYTSNPSSIELFGSGNEARDFLYVKDVAKALYTVAHKHLFDGSAINVASGISTTIQDIAKLFFGKLNTETHFNFTQTAKQGDPDILAADLTKLSLLGFTPSHQLSEGLEKYIQWLQEKK
jgi:dTDP-glucose 4,6-dehydratase/UDP-glucose 4-epimerase